RVHYLVLRLRRHHALIRRLIERHHHQNLAAQLFLIELECPRAIPAVVQVRVHLHFSCSPLPRSASYKVAPVAFSHFTCFLQVNNAYNDVVASSFPARTALQEIHTQETHERSRKVPPHHSVPLVRCQCRGSS